MTSDLGVFFNNADCPLDLSRSNFTLAASLCSKQEDRGKCCRYINAMVAISVSKYANTTSKLGVTSDLSDICLHTISKTFELYGVTKNASVFCGFGTKIPLSYDCQGRSTVTQMLESPNFNNVTENCKVPLSGNPCRKCLNSGTLYLRNTLGPVDNITLITCRDAMFVALTSQVDYMSTMDIARCFFGVQVLISPKGLPLFWWIPYKLTDDLSERFMWIFLPSFFKFCKLLHLRLFYSISWFSVGLDYCCMNVVCLFMFPEGKKWLLRRWGAWIFILNM